MLRIGTAKKIWIYTFGVNLNVKIMARNNNLSDSKVKQLLIECATIGANHALEKSGAISPFIARSDIVKQIGRSKYDKAVRDGDLTIIKGVGANSKILCKRADYERLLLNTTHIIKED